MTLLLAALAVALAGCSDDSDSSDDGTTVTITLNNASIAGKTFTYSDTRSSYENTITFGDDGKTFTYERTYTGTTGEGSGTGKGSGTVNDFSDTQSAVFYEWGLDTYPLDTISEAITLTFTAADDGLTSPSASSSEKISAGDGYLFYFFCRAKKSGEVTYAYLSSSSVDWFNYNEQDIKFVWGSL